MYKLVPRKVRRTFRGSQALQPEPQPPIPVPSGSSSPSSTWNEWPQPHDDETFGLSILNPDSLIVFRKSISAPWRYGALNGSTTTRTPSTFSSWSPSTAARSKPSAYWNPEHPPPWTATRRTSASPAGSSAISSLILAAAVAVKETRVAGCLSVAIELSVPPGSGVLTSTL